MPKPEQVWRVVYSCLMCNSKNSVRVDAEEDVASALSEERSCSVCGGPMCALVAYEQLTMEFIAAWHGRSPQHLRGFRGN